MYCTVEILVFSAFLFYMIRDGSIFASFFFLGIRYKSNHFVIYYRSLQKTDFYSAITKPQTFTEYKLTLYVLLH